MSPEALQLTSQAFYLILIISMPPILVASIVGVCLSLIQAVTQLQEQTLSFGVKLIAVCITMFATAGWLAAELLRFGQKIFENFYSVF